MKSRVVKLFVVLIISVVVFSVAFEYAGAAEIPLTGDSYNIVNVKNYGAAGDGITDDSAAVKKAIEAAQSRTLYFPAGQYNLNNTVITVNTDLNIAGDPDGATKLVNPGYIYCKKNVSVKDIDVSAREGIFLYLKPAGLVNLTIENVTYTGDRSRTRFVYCGGSIGIENVRITNCAVSDSRYGVMLSCPVKSGLISGNTFTKIGDPEIFQSTGAIVLGTNYVQANNVTISDNRISDVSAAYSTKNDGRECQGILVYSGGGCVIENNYLENITGGQDTEGIYCKATDIKILNNTLINTGDGGDGAIVNKKSSEKNDIIISGNTIISDKVSPRVFGIHVTGEKFTISNNNITLKSGIAIYKASTFQALDAVITNNTIDVLGRTAIYINNLAGNAIVTGNKITLVQQTTDKPDAVINLTKTQSTGSILISDNEIRAENTRLFNNYLPEAGAVYTVFDNKFESNSTFTKKTIGLFTVDLSIDNEFSLIG